jgi:hypothetical protein
MTIALNITWANPERTNGGILTRSPVLLVVDNFGEFKEMIRDDLIVILDWTFDKYIPLSHTTISFVVFDDDYPDVDWDFEIRCENIKGFEKYKGMSREEFEQMMKAKDRYEKLKELIDERI